MINLPEKMAAFTDYDRFDALFRVLRGEYEKQGLPLRGAFELTPQCTLNCKMCYVHTASGRYPLPVLNGDDWIEVMDEAIDAGMLYATLTGGECIVHPDFQRIYAHLKQRGVFVSLLTNGTLLDVEMVTWLQQSPPSLVTISIYGSDAVHYGQVTGDANAFSQVDVAIDLLNEAKIPVSLSIAVSRYTLDDFEDILQYALNKPHQSMRVDCDMQEPRKETNRDLQDFALTFAEKQRVWETYYRYLGKNVAPLCSEDYELLANTVPQQATEEQLRLPCAAGRCIFFISYGGVMKPCVTFELAKANVLEAGFMPAWRTINNAANAYVRSAECQACQYLGKCAFCAAIYTQYSKKVNDKAESVSCHKKSRIMQLVMSQKLSRNEDAT